MTKSPFLNELRTEIRLRHYSIRTEQTYLHWVVRFIRFHKNKHPKEMHDTEVIAFLTYLAVERNVAANTQNLALSALVFLYKRVLKKPLGDLSTSVRAKKPQKLPTVLSREEVTKVLQQFFGTNRLMASLIYGSGLRSKECLQLKTFLCNSCTGEWSGYSYHSGTTWA